VNGGGQNIRKTIATRIGATMSTDSMDGHNSS